MASAPHVTTGYTSLDSILDGLRMGDNVVWKVVTIEDYQSLLAQKNIDFSIFMKCLIKFFDC